MGRPDAPTCKTLNWPADNEALKRRVSLTIWFDPDMTWEATPDGKRGRPQACSDASIQTCLTMKLLFGMVDIVAPLARATMSTRQTTGFVESLLRLIGLDWAVPDFSTRCRRQRTLAVNIRYRGSQDPLHRLIDSEPVSATGSSEPARGSSQRAKARGMRASMAAPGGGSSARSTSGSTRRHRRFGPSGSPAATWGTRPCCLRCPARSHPVRGSPVSPQTAPTTPESTMTPSPNPKSGIALLLLGRVPVARVDTPHLSDRPLIIASLPNRARIASVARSAAARLPASGSSRSSLTSAPASGPISLNPTPIKR